ncbi:acyltransferase [Weissella paramesenteroides]
MVILRIFNYIKKKIGRFFLIRKNKDNLILGENIYWRSRFSVIIEDNGKLVIGDGCLFNFDCSITCLGQISIGNSSIFGENVKIYDHNHKFNKKNTIISKQGMSVGKVKVGNNCWIGSNVTILKGADIGNNCVIGAGAIISSTIPDNTLVRIKDNYQMEGIKFRD